MGFCCFEKKSLKTRTFTISALCVVALSNGKENLIGENQIDFQLDRSSSTSFTEKLSDPRPSTGHSLFASDPITIIAKCNVVSKRRTLLENRTTQQLLASIRTCGVCILEWKGDAANPLIGHLVRLAIQYNLRSHALLQTTSHYTCVPHWNC